MNTIDYNSTIKHDYDKILSIDKKRMYLVMKNKEILQLVQRPNQNNITIWGLNKVFKIDMLNTIRHDFNDENWALLQKEIFDVI